MSEARRPVRLPYEPPRIRKVKLVPGEVAVAACKSIQVAPNVCRRGGQLFVRTIGS